MAFEPPTNAGFGAAGRRAKQWTETPGSGTSTFSEAGDFETALYEEGTLSLVVTGSGRFAAKLTRVALSSDILVAGEERLSRVAFLRAPANDVVIAFPADDQSRLIWGGRELGADEIATLGSGSATHARTEGPSRWGSVRLPAREAARVGCALLGAAFALSGSPACWRGAPAAQGRLRRIHAAAIRAAEARPASLMDREAAHGLEQQIIEALIGCLGRQAKGRDRPVGRRNQAIAERLEDVLRNQADARSPLAELCGALGVSESVLRACCEEQFGISPSHYMRLRRLQRVRRALLAGDGRIGSLAAVAHRCGERDLKRLSAAYRAFFGELPSATLRRTRRGGMAQLATARP